MIHLWRWVPGGNPDCIYSQRLEVGKAGANSLDITLAITIGVREGANINLISDGIAPPRTFTTHR